MIPEEIVDRVRSGTPILDLISPVVQLQKSGGVWKGLCPLHDEKTPSFTVSERKNSFKCWGCSAEGSPIDWMMQYHGLDFPDAVRALAQPLNISVDDVEPAEFRKQEPRRKQFQPPRPLPSTIEEFGPGSPEQHIQLATLRGFRPNTVRVAERRQFVAFAGNQWCVRDETGVNGERRLLSGEKYGGGIKAKNFPGSWGGWPLGCTELRPGFSVLLCEGSPDFIAGLEVCLAGLRADPVGILGASNSIHHAALPFFRRKRVLIAAHRDAAGEAAVERWTKMLPQSEVHIIRIPNYVESDLNDWIMDTETTEVVEEIEKQYLFEKETER